MSGRPPRFPPVSPPGSTVATPYGDNSDQGGVRRSARQKRKRRSEGDHFDTAPPTPAEHRQQNAAKPLPAGANAQARVDGASAKKVKLKPGVVEPQYPSAITAHRGLSPLHAAAAKGDLPALIACLEAGANIEERSPYGWTVFHYAVAFGADVEMINALVSGIPGPDGYLVRANVHATTDQEQYNALHLVMLRAMYPDELDIKTILINSEKRQRTNTVEVLKALLRAGVSPNVRDNSRQSALDYLVAAREHLHHAAMQSPPPADQQRVTDRIAELYARIDIIRTTQLSFIASERLAAKTDKAKAKLDMRQQECEARISEILGEIDYIKTTMEHGLRGCIDNVMYMEGILTEHMARVHDARSLEHRRAEAAMRQRTPVKNAALLAEVATIRRLMDPAEEADHGDAGKAHAERDAPMTPVEPVTPDLPHEYDSTWSEHWPGKTK